MPDLIRYSSLPTDEAGSDLQPHSQEAKTDPLRLGWTRVLLCVSVLANIILCVLLFAGRFDGSSNVRATTYAGLEWSHSMPFNSSSELGLGSVDETTRSLAWERLDTSAGEISLDNTWAKERGLPESTPFFWDKSRSIYLLNSYHLLHCMRKVRRWVTISQYNGTQLDSYVHLVHCMDQLAQNIICQADDTPLYTSPTHNATTGDGQQRTCRDWSQMARWAEDQTACFGYINETQGVDAVIQRFRYCPENSTYATAMKNHFGLDESWDMKRPEDVESMPRYWENFPV